MSRNLHRLFAPKTIALIGGGMWGESLLAQCEKFAFTGKVWIVHPKKDCIAGQKTYRDLASLPEAPDVAFVGVNREATVAVVRELSAMDAGGAVCFASGFAEAVEEYADGGDLQDALLEVAGDMPILGPNCYGFINGLERCILWPDHHGLAPCASGVAILAQSSNIAINLSMQKRGLPIAAIMTLGNQAQINLCDVAEYWLEDERITAMGFYIEGMNDPARWCTLAERADALNKPLVALKVGNSAQAQAATLSHTASLAGSAAGATALLQRLGIAEVFDLETLLETLKIAHCQGWVMGNRFSSMSCSGGEASLMADIASRHCLDFPPLPKNVDAAVHKILGDAVKRANPLDYHTYIWGDYQAMHATYLAMMNGGWSYTLLVIDYPRISHEPLWDLAIDALIEAHKIAKCPVAVVASLPENLPENLAQKLMANAIVPLFGFETACKSLRAMQRRVPDFTPPFVAPAPTDDIVMLDEVQAKRYLRHHGLATPRGHRVTDQAELYNLSTALQFPVVLKGLGFAHKTEAGAVKLGLTTPDQVVEASEAMPTETFLLEEMISDIVCELLVGITHDPAHGYLLTVGAGGQDTELLQDTVTLSLPARESDIRAALLRLRIAAKFDGYRHQPAIDMTALCACLKRLQEIVVSEGGRIQELEINPLLCSAKAIWIADALITTTAKVGGNPNER